MMKKESMLFLVMLLGLLSLHCSVEAQTKAKAKQFTVKFTVKEKNSREAVIMATCLLYPLQATPRRTSMAKRCSRMCPKASIL